MKLKSFFSKEKLVKLKKTGFFSIFLSTVFSKVLVFIGGTIIVRILSKSDYGIYAYVLNCISMLTIFYDFGASTAALQYLTEDEKKGQEKGKIFNYTLKITLIASLFSCGLIFFSNLFYPFKIEEAINLTRFLFLTPIISFFGSLFPIILRANLDNKKYAISQVFATLVSYLSLILLSIFFGLKGAIVSQYLYYLLVLLFSLYLSFEYLKKYKTKEKLDKSVKKEFLKFAVGSQINNTIGGLLIIVDTFVIGILISDPEIIATYKVGSAIPHALTFISSCVAIYIIPYFIKNNRNERWVKKNLKRIILYGCVGYGVLFGGIILLSKYIIKIIYGSNYLNSLPVFITLMIGLFFTSAIKVPCSNFIHSLKKVKINIIVNVISVILNAILNFIFINKFGFVGAAITTMLINIFASFFYLWFLNKVLKKEVLVSDSK